MAIDKIGSKALTDSSVVAADISPGTITADKLASTLNVSSKTVTLPNTSVTSGMLAGSIANAKLANSTVTVNGTSIALGASGSIPAVSWQSVVVSNGSTVTTMVAGNGYFVNNTSAAGLVKLPLSASAGDTIAIKDYAGNFGTNSLTIQRNGHNIQGVANDSQISTNRASLSLVYVDSTKGWLYAVESNVADLESKGYTSATGGTVTTSGDYKIHTFTGDGCFVVSSAGFPSPSGLDTVDYLVAAGGGGGGGQYIGGGGGAGGFRFAAPSLAPLTYPGKPLAAPAALGVSAATYPITVGGGGTGNNQAGDTDSTRGSNSVFSTITSTGGGAGKQDQGPGNNTGQPGGSGGGGAGGNPGSGPNADEKGSGNTPSVSPPQGNPGGNGGAPGSPAPGSGSGSPFVAGGGGGAIAAGGCGTRPNSTGGAGGVGAGVPNAFGTSGQPSGGYYYFAGGGGGNASTCGGAAGPATSGTGGLGGGGAGQPNSAGTAGTANTGGGGGGTDSRPGPNAGGAGGSGIVIIRYKFQN
jgi:hypothetical protein